MRLPILIALLVCISLPSVAYGKTAPWERDWDGDPPAYFFNTGDGAFWVFNREIEQLSNGIITLWLHGDHRSDSKVPYRSSLWHVRFDCSGGYTVNASTTFDASGSVVDSWDGIGSRSLIRPGSMYQSLASQLCKDNPPE